jgi:type I restriction enzyme S subunit
MAEQHEKALVPQIRFAGFTDPWEQRKLGELYQKNDERNTDGLGSERTLSVASMTFNSTGNGADESSLPNYKRLQLGDIAFEGHANKEFAYGRFVLNDAGNGIMSPRFTCLRPIVEQEYSFWKYFIHSEKVMRPILVNSTKSGTMMNELVVEDFLEQEILVPSLPEQHQIGAFFNHLDSLITLHQRKYDKLCVLKKSMLDKMFPKGGSLYPEIRFAGFTDPWEQRKLGELFEEHSEKDRDDLPALTIIQGGGTVHRDESNRNLQFDRNSLSNYKVVDTGDFIVHLRSFEGGLEKATCCGLVSPAYHIFRGKNVDSDFYYLYFRSKRFIDADLKPHVYGIRDGRSIDIEGMKTIFIPWTNLAEQRRIGAFFDHLDSLITLHQRKYCGVVSWMLGVALVRLSSEK